MRKLKPWFWKGLLLLLCGAFILALGWSRWTFPSSNAKVVTQSHLGRPASSQVLPIAGTASCSARGCHGGIDPMSDSHGNCQQNEFTLWVQDRHANAYL